jgi:uncharacterized DUF497 family protein
MPATQGAGLPAGAVRMNFALRVRVHYRRHQKGDITVISAMRFQFDEDKSRRVQKKHGVSLEEAREIFDQVHIIDRKNDDPEQFRAIGWCQDRLCSVIFEIRRDHEGEYYRLITAWRATKQEEDVYADQA